MSKEPDYTVLKNIYEEIKHVPKPDLGKIARVTRLNKLGKGRTLLIAAAVTWSTLTCSLTDCNAASIHRLAAALGPAGSVFTTGVSVTRLGGVPYKNRQGEVVISGSASDRDYLLAGCEPQAQATYNVARAIEPAITMDMLELADQLGTTMEGLEYSVKTASSIRSKIDRKTDKALEMGENPKSDVEYIQETGDLIRYTQVVTHDKMAEKTKQTIQLLQEKGYTVEKVDNKYLNPEGRYKAIHLDVLNEQGQRFEMQIHSPETLAANKSTHGMYEEWRKPETAPQRKEELFAQIKATYDALPLPKDIMTVENYSRSA